MRSLPRSTLDSLICPFSSSLFKGEPSCGVSRIETRRFPQSAWARPRLRLGELVSAGSGLWGGLHCGVNPGGLCIRQSSLRGMLGLRGTVGSADGLGGWLCGSPWFGGEGESRWPAHLGRPRQGRPCPPTGFAEGTPRTQPHLSEYSSATNGTAFSLGLGTCTPGKVQGCSFYSLPLKTCRLSDTRWPLRKCQSPLASRCCPLPAPGLATGSPSSPTCLGSCSEGSQP